MITTTPTGAQIGLDGEHVGTTALPNPVTVDAMHHVVEATLDGYVPARQEVVVMPLDSVDMLLTLEAVPAEAGSGGGPGAAGSGCSGRPHPCQVSCPVSCPVSSR